MTIVSAMALCWMFVSEIVVRVEVLSFMPLEAL